MHKSNSLALLGGHAPDSLVDLCTGGTDGSTPPAPHFVVLNGAAVQRGEIDVMQTLAGIPKTKIQELRRNLAGVAPMLQYSIDDSVRNDAFEALLRGALAVATERERLRDGHARHESAVVLNALL